MRLTQHTDFALRVLIYLGLNDRDLATIQAISDAYGISKNHLMKVVRELVSHGYVASTRGIGGGIRLAKPAEQINVGAVVRDMEPDFALVECFRPDNACVITPACLLPNMLSQASKAFMQELDQYTLRDLLPRRAQTKLRNLLSIG
jgi:Rrf2 family transcriptional regulator, nitric oxide-sensitive transcriptional repressor